MDIEALCECGESLDAEFVNGKHVPQIEASACEKCLEAARDEAHTQGYQLRESEEGA